jgi:ParB-like chromosome segregation protein Spo0J
MTKVRTKNASASTAQTREAPAVWEDPNLLLPWAKNPKPIEAKDVREMMRSIKRFGFGAPIVARKANKEIIEGHLRRPAAINLATTDWGGGPGLVPVRYLDISEHEAHMLALAAIKFEKRRKPDQEMIIETFVELNEAGVNLETGTSYTADEIDVMLLPNDTGEATVRAHQRRNKPPKKDGGRFIVQVECDDEPIQKNLLRRLMGEGFEVKALVS